MKLKDSGWWTVGAGCNRNVVSDIAAEGLDLLHKYEFRTLIADKKALTSSSMNLVPHQFDHSSLARLGSLLAIGSLSLMGWKKASKRPVATCRNDQLA